MKTRMGGVPLATLRLPLLGAMALATLMNLSSGFAGTLARARNQAGTFLSESDDERGQVRGRLLKRSRFVPIYRSREEALLSASTLLGGGLWLLWFAARWTVRSRNAQVGGIDVVCGIICYRVSQKYMARGSWCAHRHRVAECQRPASGILRSIGGRPMMLVVA